MRCPEFFRRSISAAAGWSTARWSIRCRSRRRARSAPASSSPSIWRPTGSAAAPPSPATAPTPATVRRAAQPDQARNGFARLRGMFGAERALKRQILAGDSRPSFSTVMIESFNIMQDRLTRMRLAGDPPDVHITPRIGSIGWLDFHRAAEAIDDRSGRHRKGASSSITESIAELRLSGNSLRRRLLRAGGLAGDLLRRAIELTVGAHDWHCRSRSRRWSAACRAPGTWSGRSRPAHCTSSCNW